jgi:hypothetical protein
MPQASCCECSSSIEKYTSAPSRNKCPRGGPYPGCQSAAGAWLPGQRPRSVKPWPEAPLPPAFSFLQWVGLGLPGKSCCHAPPSAASPMTATSISSATTHNSTASSHRPVQLEISSIPAYEVLLPASGKQQGELWANATQLAAP